jgi:hypothetical protein
MTAAPYSLHSSYADYLGGYEASAFSLDGHDHDARYCTEFELNTTGTINSVGNPVDWTKLRNVPAGFAVGVKGFNMDYSNYAMLAWGHSAVSAYNPTHGQEAWLSTDIRRQAIAKSCPRTRIYCR